MTGQKSPKFDLQSLFWKSIFKVKMKLNDYEKDLSYFLNQSWHFVLSSNFETLYMLKTGLIFVDSYASQPKSNRKIASSKILLPFTWKPH